MNKLCSLLKQDSKLAIRNGYIAVVIILAIIYILLIRFVVPEELKIGISEIAYDVTDGNFNEYLKDFPEDRLLTSNEEFYLNLNDNPNTIGIIFDGTIKNPKVTIVKQGTEYDKALNLLEASIKRTLADYKGEADNATINTTYLRPQSDKIPFNKSLLPLFLSTEVISFGFIIIAVMVFQEKTLGTLKAYRVSPGGVFNYVFSKTIVNVAMAMIFGMLLTVGVMGFDIPYLEFLSVIALASILMTLLGIWLSVYFDDLESFLFVGVGLICIFAIPLMSYLFPTFSYRFFEYIPSYPIIFGVREMLFYTGKENFLLPMFFTLIVEILGVGIITLKTVKKRLLKGA